MRLTPKTTIRPVFCTPVAAAVAVAVAVFMAPVESAQAYPQFQLSTYSTTCTACHFSPAGGGLVNGFGRDEAGDTLSQFGGDGGFLHGLWTPPDSVQLGADFRFAPIYKKTSTEPQLLFVPMQADIYSRFAFWKLSFNLIAGVRGRDRDPDRELAISPWSREHYLMYSSDDSPYYARLGRFMVPYGLRVPDHSSYIRKYLGTHTLEEILGLSGGRIADKWEVHATLFVPYPLFPVGRQAVGAALYYERRAREDSAAYGMQTRADTTSDDRQFWLGGVGKLWLDSTKLLFLSQLDFGVQSFRKGDADARLQMAFYLGVTYFLKPGVMLGSTIERYDADLTLKGSARDSINLSLRWLPYAHVELQWLNKLDFPGGVGKKTSPMSLLMFHYYL